MFLSFIILSTFLPSVVFSASFPSFFNESAYETSGHKPEIYQLEYSGGCISGYTWFSYTNFCYKSTARAANFNDAHNACRSEGSELASIHSLTENQFLVQLSAAGNRVNSKTNYVMIGLIFENREWSWTDGSSVNYLNWAAGEPNNMKHELWTALVSDVNPKKGQMYTHWNNVNMDRQRAYICKRAPLN